MEQEFRRLFREARKAGDGDPHALRGVLHSATEDEWLLNLADPPTRAAFEASLVRKPAHEAEG